MATKEEYTQTPDVDDGGDASYTTDARADVPVVKDDAPVDSQQQDNPDSDAALQRDDAEAIDKDNIVNERTRGAKPQGGYREPGDDEGIPTDD